MCHDRIPYMTTQQYFVGKLGLPLVDGSEYASFAFPTSVLYPLLSLTFPEGPYIQLNY